MSKQIWKWNVLRKYGIYVDLKRGWCRVAVSEARQWLSNELFKKVMHEVEWTSFI